MASIHIQHTVIIVLLSTLLYLDSSCRFKCSIMLQHQHQHEPKPNPCQEIETSERYTLAYLVSTSLYIFWNCIILWNEGRGCYDMHFSWCLHGFCRKLYDKLLPHSSCNYRYIYKDRCAYVSCFNIVVALILTSSLVQDKWLSMIKMLYWL